VLQPSSPDGRAVAVALADPGMKDVLAGAMGNYHIDDVAPQGQSTRSGIIDFGSPLMTVNLSIPMGMYAPDRYVEFVDLSHSRVVSSEWYSYRGFPAEMDITLPPGASYYHILSGPVSAGLNQSEGFGVQTFWGRVDKLSPENASLYTILIDEENLSKLKNGSPYVAVTYNDTGTGKLNTMNGTSPVKQGWMVNASVRRAPRYDTGSWPDFDFSQRYYLVFKNLWPETVSFSVQM
jgi:hypothetical protein